MGAWFGALKLGGLGKITMNSATPASRASSSIAAAGERAYAPLAILLHWTLAILVIGTIVLGWYIVSLGRDPAAEHYVGWHQSIGLIIAALVLVRLAWRLTHKPAPLPGSVPGWQVKAANISHKLLYAAIVVMPLSGITASLLSKRGIVFFGWALPRLFDPDRALARIFYATHWVTAWILMTLLAVHVLAALKHLLIDRDGVFQRMWPVR